MGFEEPLHDLAVFLRLQTAGGIDDPAAGLDPAGRLGQQGLLNRGESRQFRWFQAPAQFHPAAQDSGVGAGRIDQNSREAFPGRGQDGDVGHVGDAQPGAVFAQQRQPVLGRVMGDDVAGVLHELRGPGRFAAGSGTEVEEGFTGLRGQHADGEQRAGILNIESALEETGERTQRRMRLQREDQPVARPVEAAFREIHALAQPGAGQIGSGSPQGVDPHEGRGGRVVPSTELGQAGGSVACFPTVGQPARKRPAGGGIRVAQRFQALPDLLTLAGASAEHRIHEPALRSESELAGEGDGFVDGRMVRHAIEPKQLVKSQPEEVLQSGFLDASLGALGHQPVERGTPAQNPQHQLLGKAPIHRPQRGEGGIPLQPTLGKIARTGLLVQEPGGKLSWCGNHRAGILARLH